MRRTPAAALALATFIAITGCSSQPAAAPSAAATPSGVTSAPASAATSQTPSASTADFKSSMVDPDLLPATIGTWTLDRDLVYYHRGSIAKGNDEIVTIMVEDSDAAGWIAAMTEKENVASGFCGIDVLGYETCAADTPLYGLVIVAGKGMAQSREIADVVFPLL